MKVLPAGLAAEAIRVTSQRRRQHLDRDLALQVRVRRAVDLAHAALTEGRGHLIGAETGSGSQRQRVGL